MYMYVYMYVRVSMYVYMYVHTHTHTKVHTFFKKLRAASKFQVPEGRHEPSHTISTHKYLASSRDPVHGNCAPQNEAT